MNARIHRFPFGTTIAMAIAMLLLPARAALGLALTVNSTADEPAADPAISTCISTPSGQCTLRAAIMVTNFFAGPHTITMPSGTFTLTRPGYDDAALVGDLDIVHDLTIQGAGSAATIIDGNGSVTQDRVFQVLSTVNNVTLSGMTIKNGKSLASSGGVIGGGGLYIEDAGQVHLRDVIVEGNTGQIGGGIYANLSSRGGSITMDHVIVRGNTAVGVGVGSGGGVFLLLASSISQVQATIQDSQIYSNRADSTGGGLYAYGTTTTRWTIQRSEIYSNTAASGGAIGNFVPLALSDSHLHDNRASFDGGAMKAFAPYTILRTTLDANSAGRFGGAIFNSQTAGTFPEFAHIEQSTLSGNFAKFGGAIYHDGFIVPGSLLVLLNSTVSGNAVTGGDITTTPLLRGGGGGIFIYGGQTLLLNATVVGNHVNFAGGPGGGLFIMASANFKARSSLIANNWHNGTILQGPIADDGYTNVTNGDGTTGELAFDLIRTTTNFFITGPQGGNIVGQDPLLGPLQNNGGPTQTHALLPGSPAIDTGAPAGCTKDVAAVTPLTIDQRGAPRPYPAGGRCDIGAFELRPPVTLDIDGSNTATKYDALTDGLLAIRYMSGLTGTALTTGALGATATRTDPAAYLDANRWAFDIDGDGNVDALTDGLLIVRYLFGLRGASLIQGAFVQGAPRNTAPLIEAYLGVLTP